MKISKLRRIGLKYLNDKRGHRFGKFKRSYEQKDENSIITVLYENCPACGRRAQMTDKPEDGETFYDGEAFETNCPNSTVKTVKPKDDYWTKPAKVKRKKQLQEKKEKIFQKYGL